MKRIHTLFHRMVNRSCKFQGFSLIYTGMPKDLDAPVLLLTLGMRKKIFSWQVCFFEKIIHDNLTRIFKPDARHEKNKATHDISLIQRKVQ